MAFLVGGANSAAADAGYNIDNSCRFNDDDSPYLTISSLGSTASDAKKWTVSFWTKLGSMGSHRCFFSVGTSDPDENSQLNITNVDTLQAYSSTTFGEGGSATNIKTNAVYRDSAAWYHIVWAMDSTESTNTDRIKLYVNGVRVTSFGTASNYPAEDTENDLVGANSVPHYVGQYVNGSQYNDTYMAEFYFIDGTAYDADDFGETDEDSGIWKPKNASVTFGNNGFFLEFKASGVGTASSSTIGADTSGNDNHFTSSGLTVLDQCTDTPTNNFCTLNPLWSGAAGTLSEGNTKLVSGSSEYGPILGTIAMTSGKWYWEVLCTTFNYWRTGIADVTLPVATDWNLGYESSPDNAVYRDGGIVAKNASAILTGQPSLAVDETVSVAFDADSGKIWFAQDGTWINSGDPAAGSNEATSVTTGESYYPALSDGSSSTSSTYSFNFGNPPHSISSGNADANGYGNFEYAVPSGFYALCTKNLAEFG